MFNERKYAHELDINPAGWETSINTYFMHDWPQLAKIMLKLELTQKDTTRGMAVGSIVLKNGYKIPIIINAFKLMPFDVIISPDNTYRYLTQDIADSLIGIKSNNDLFKATNANEIKQTFNMEKEASTRKATHYKAIYGFSFEPTIAVDGEPVSFEKVASELSSEELQKLLTEGELVKIEGEPFLKFAGLIYMKEENNTRQHGYGYELRTLDGKSKDPQFLILDKNARYWVTDDDTYLADDNADPTPTLKHMVEKGDTIIVLDRDGHGAYGPYEVLEISNVDQGYALTVKELHNVEYPIYKLNFVTYAQKITPINENEYLLPQLAIAVVKPKDYMTENSVFNKTAALDEAEMSFTITAKDGKYQIASHLLPPSLKGWLTKTMAIEALHYLGSTYDEAKQALESLGNDGTATLKYKHIIKTSEILDAIDAPKIKQVQEQAKSIIKTAEKIPSIKNSVDEALGLFLLTPKRLKRFKMETPKIEEVINQITQLLVAKRLDPGRIPANEEDIRDVLEGLTSLLNTIKMF